ncbi:MAG: HAD-IIIA family hydrolase [Tepidisphaeraceae bacterium]
MKRPAVFFDRDNTLIACDDYLGEASKVALVSGAASAVARARKLGYVTAVFSNQSGVARGYFSEEAVHAVNQRMDELLRDGNDKAVIDRHDFCPYHPDASIEKYRQDSPLRKPGPGMILAAAEALALDLSRSWVIGDAPRDIEAGHAAGCRTILFADPLLKSSPAAQVERMVEPDYVCSTLNEALDFIEKSTERRAEEHGDEQEEEKDQAARPDPPSAPSASSENMDLVADMSMDTPPRGASATRQAAAGVADAPASTSTPKLEALALDILRELRRRHEQPEQDFSVSKLLAGVVQVIVLFVLFLALLNRADDKSLVPLLLFALTLQAMTIAMLIMGRQR